MRVLRGTVRFLDWLSDTSVLIVCLILFMIGMYSVYDSYMMYREATDDSILKYKPGYEQEVEDNRKILSSMRGWITIDDTTIDYPIMQGMDNIEFINKDPFGDYSLAGSIFLDCRNSSDFSDGYNLVYGHHMEGGAMFGALDDYSKDNFLKEHSKGSLTVGDHTYKIRLYACFYTDATNETVFSPTEHDGDVCAYVEEHAHQFIKKWAPKEGDKLIALSTCRYPETTERTVVIGVLS